MMAGGDVRVGAGLNVGIDAEGGAGAEFEAGGFGGQDVELGFGFDVEEEDAGLEGFADFFFALPYAGENDAAAGDSDVAEAMKFAAGDDVEVAACTG